MLQRWASFLNYIPFSKMKFVLLLLFANLIYETGLGQDLSGRWKGTMALGDKKITFSNVYLTFTPSPDGYSVLSSRNARYINVSDTSAITVFNVKFQVKGKNRLLLDEFNLISPDTLKKICFTSYRLKITKAHNQTLLEGRFFQRACSEAANIFFIKVD